jgi:hypothetical protein
MNKLAAFLLTIVSVNAVASLPITPITIDCKYAAVMSRDLEKIIANPSITNRQWDNLFATVSGNQTDQQRLQSAKVVLWTIRTQCVGY